MTTTPGNPEIEDINQITAAVIGHLRANPEAQKRTENVIQVFLGGAIASMDDEAKKSSFQEENENAPPEAVGLANYLEQKKKELLAAGYTPEQASMILMGQLGALSVYTAIANNEKKISIVRRVMAHQIRKGAKAQEQEQAQTQAKPTTTLGQTSQSHRDRARFAMRGRGHRGRT